MYSCFLVVRYMFLFVCLFPSLALGATLSKYLLSLDIEQLMEIEITSAAKHPQKLSDAPAAVYVITSDDIHHSFVNHLPELLRDVPGVHVARASSHVWSISIRGFNDRFGNKLLVLMDGRTLYTPLFSGVLWEKQDTVLDDIDRIEVIRGPGASLWGANAVNGVINIVTKSAQETQGFLGSLVVGKEESKATLRYGGKIGENAAYRLYMKAKEVDSMRLLHDGSAHDDWRMAQGGFRLDWDFPSKKQLTFSGDVYSLTSGSLSANQLLFPPYEIFETTDGHSFGANILAKLSHEDINYNWSLQAYYDTSRTSGYPLLNWNLDVWDLDFQYSLTLSSRQKLTFGAGYQLFVTDVEDSDTYTYDPSNKKIYIVNSFFQDEITLCPDKLFLTLGSKFEYHDISGLEIQPSARILWKINQSNIFWAGVSRAVRTPSIGEKDAAVQLTIPPASKKPGFSGFSTSARLPLQLRLEGNDDVDSEELIAFEVGYRTNFSNKVSFDVTAFLNLYDDLIALVAPREKPILDPFPNPHLIAVASSENVMDGETYGLEIDSKIDLNKNWRLFLSYSYLKLFFHATRKTLYLGEELEDLWPRHIFSIRSRYAFPKNIYFDLRLRYVDKLKGFSIPSYLATDFRVDWHINKNLEVSIVGQNIFDPAHPEFGQSYALRNPIREVERNFFIKFLWSF